jgi:hypothetical protein
MPVSISTHFCLDLRRSAGCHACSAASSAFADAFTPESGGLRGGHLPLELGHRGSRIAGKSRGFLGQRAEPCGANHTGVGAEEQAVTPDDFMESTERQRAPISASGEAPAERGGEREAGDQ